MGSCREILTLQLGTYANLVGTHSWNIQESTFEYTPGSGSEICHDVLFREGLSRKGQVTFSPRLICVDRATKLPPIPILEEPVGDSAVLWDTDRLEKVDNPNEGLHPFIKDLEEGKDVASKQYSFETTTRSWSDLLRTRLHPKSLLLGYKKAAEDVEDRVRSFVEECDNLQGFHVLIDASDAFPEVLLHLEDEYSSKGILTFPLLACAPEERQWREAATRHVSVLRNYHDSATSTTLTVPLSCISQLSLKSDLVQSFPNLCYLPDSNYHTSAILASFIDTYTLAYRFKDSVRMSDIISGLASRNWKFSAASLALPFPKLPEISLRQALESRNDEEPLWQSLSPNALIEDSWYQNMILRGINEGDVLLEYLRFLSSTSSAVKSFSCALPTLAPFPRFFSPHVSCKGSVDISASRVEGFEVASCPVLAGLHACPGVGEMLQNITMECKKIDIRRIPELDLESDLWQEILEAMKTLARDHSNIMDID